MSDQNQTPDAAEKPAKATAPKPAESGKVCARNHKWGRPVANAHRARSRRVAAALYCKQPGMDEETFKAEAERNSEVVGLDPATIITLISLAWKLYQWWKSKKATAVQVQGGLPEGELDIDFDIEDE